jgi:hypothetical protein
MNPNENDIVGFGFDSCYLDFHFCCTGYKRAYAGEDLQRLIMIPGQRFFFFITHPQDSPQ